MDKKLSLILKKQNFANNFSVIVKIKINIFEERDWLFKNLRLHLLGSLQIKLELKKVVVSDIQINKKLRLGFKNVRIRTRNVWRM